MGLFGKMREARAVAQNIASEIAESHPGLQDRALARVMVNLDEQMQRNGFDDSQRDEFEAEFFYSYLEKGNPEGARDYPRPKRGWFR